MSTVEYYPPPFTYGSPAPSPSFSTVLTLSPPSFPPILLPSFPFLRLEDRVNKVLRSSPSSLPWHEKDIRLLHRLTFLIPSRNDHEYGFWITQILKPWPITFQARLLYLLTGPEDGHGKESKLLG